MLALALPQLDKPGQNKGLGSFLLWISVRLWELGHGSRLSTGRGSAVHLLFSSSSLVSTNEHLLQELGRTRAQHRAEVEQMHWSFQEFKKTTALFPRHSSRLGGRQSC